MEIKKHRLTGENIRFDPTPKISGKFGEGLPDTIIVHYTAGDSTDMAVATLKNPKIKASAHFVVGKDGEIVQLADLNVITWHAGKSFYKMPDGPRSYFNKYAIGIEIVNDGWLKKKDGKYFNWYGKEVPANEVYEGKHRNYPHTTTLYWRKYPENQIKRVYELCEVLMKNYPIKYILGHEEIAPDRKFDPGPAFPLDDLREKMKVWMPPTAIHEIKREPMPMGTVAIATTKLNFRSGPGTGYEIIAETVEKDEKVFVLAKAGDWYEVQQYIRGWVASEYIIRDDTDDENDGIVNANLLNIRNKPDGEKVAKPLKKGQKVKIYDRKENWYYVETLVTGWVFGKYLKIIQQA